jgi:hypothetical protein
MAPSPAPTPAPVAVPRWVAFMSAQPLAATAKAVAHKVDRMKGACIFMTLSFQKNIRFVVAPSCTGHDRETDRSVLLQIAGWRTLYAASTDQANQDHDDGDDQQDVDEAAHGIGGDQTKQPQKDEYDSDCVEHDSVLFV